MPYPDPVQIETMIDRLLGIEPPDIPEDVPEEEFPTTGLERFQERLGGLSLPPPRNFGQGLAAGLLGSFAGRGRQIAGARQKFEARQEKRRVETDEARRRSTAEYRKERGEALRRVSGEQRTERTKAAEYERDNPLVTPELKAAYPALSRIPEGQRLDAATWREVQKRSLPESESDKRAAANQARLAQAAERQSISSASAVEGRLVDDYRTDPSITAYRTAQQNLATIKAASKEPSGFGDLAMLIAYVRATEPGVLSVVRQEELQNVGQAVGKLQNYMNIPNQWVSGQRLTPEGRKAIIRAGTTIAGSQKPAYEKARNIFFSRAKRANVPEDIFTDFDPPDSRPPLSSFERP